MNFNEAIEKLSAEAKDQIKDCNNLEEILELFAKNGLEVTKQDIKNAINTKSGELSDDELANVIGGVDLTQIIQDLLKMGVDYFKTNIGNTK